MSSLPSARNAMKHGFCSSHFLAEENAEHIAMIRDELEVCHDPANDEDDRLIAELALARFKVFQNDRMRHQRALEEQGQAAALFEKQAQAEYEKRLADWRKSPADHIAQLAGSKAGLEFLIRQWSEIREILVCEKATLTLHQACELAMMVGSHWQIQMLGSQGRRVFGLFLATLPLPDPEIDHWVKLSDGLAPAFDKALAQEIFLMAPAADLARLELLELVEMNLQRLQADLPGVQARHESAQAAFASKSCGLGLLDPVRTNEARLFLRYYTYDLNRADKLERVLESRMQSRLRHSRRGQQEHGQKQAQMLNVTPDWSMDRTRQRREESLPVQEKFYMKTKFEEQFKLKEDARRAAFMKKMQNHPLVVGTSGVEGLSMSTHEQGADQKAEEISVIDRHMGLLSGVNWTDKAAITNHQIDTLERLVTMQEGPRRQELIKVYFSSEAELQMAIRQFFRNSA